MNERSSRAHALLLLDLSQLDKNTGAEVTSHMCFADLGGSEQVRSHRSICTDICINDRSRRLGADLSHEKMMNQHENVLMPGHVWQVLKSEVAEMNLREAGFLQKETRMQEAVNINLGLLSLKACIQALVEKTYVPYQVWCRENL